MVDRSDITPELCRRLLRYDPETGKLFWRERDVSTFHGTKYPAEREIKRWNSRWAGEEAFTFSASGYRRGRIFEVSFAAHVVAFAIFHGNFPLGEIDHINGKKSDNRIGNLRDVGRTENVRNAPMRSDNTSGSTGVSWCRRKRAWLVRMCLAGRNKHIGYYTDLEDAKLARAAAGRDYFHENHGRTP